MAEVQAGQRDQVQASSALNRGSLNRHRRGRSGRGRGDGATNRGRNGHAPPADSSVGVSVAPSAFQADRPAISAEPGALTSRRGRGGGPNRRVRGGLPPRASGSTVDDAPNGHEAERGANAPGPTGSSGSRGGGGRRGAQKHVRGGNASVGTRVSTRRTFGGHLTSISGPTTNGVGPAPTLSADAQEFIPSQPVPQHIARQPATNKGKPKPKPRIEAKSEAPDLPTRIHEDIDNGMYECPICSSEVVRTSRIWSCSLCFTVTHSHCTKKWYTSQMKNAEQLQGQEPTWRCPGCNSSLTEEPGSYHCWCGKEINPRSISGLPPHSCGQTCMKPRGTCPHPCGLSCHGGPCPPCNLMGPVQSCFCGKHTSQKRCSDTEYNKGFSCHEPCGDLLPCGEHTCAASCHSGVCGACDIPIPSRCYCGKEHTHIPCDQRDDVLDSYNYGQVSSDSLDNSDAPPDSWFEGSFTCNTICSRKFDCGHHTCSKACHPQDEDAAHCPLSPDVVTHCPCGKTPLEEMMDEPRVSCQDKIAHCDKKCDKTLSCGHYCKSTCHTGPCAPCFETVEISCRCGRTSTTSACHQGDVQKPMCFRVCRAQLSCGRHQCDERCCPGERRAAKRLANSRKKGGVQEDVADEHLCSRICNRLLKCVKHHCDALCHRGPCPSCLEAIFEEISCACGRTVLYPPQPCGTQPPECRFPCTRRRTCGHPQVEHHCHPDDLECPKCPFLVEKACLCGKQTLKNQPCWFEEARCGVPCGMLLKCGNHTCQKSCHRPGECEDADITGPHCGQPCGKTRKSCDHECIDACHSPLPCKEDKPCQLETFITCDCQRQKKKVKCLATIFNPGGPVRELLKCDDECARVRRNRLLAEALKVDPKTHMDDHIPYRDTTLRFFKENVDFAQTQEAEFRVFAESSLKNMRFPPMKPYQRQFIHVLAEDYGFDSESQDPEGHRHVSIFKGPKFVSAPRKTLMQCLRILRTAPKPAPAPATTTNKPAQQPYNALLLSNPKFGLMINELDNALAADFAATAIGPCSSLSFTTSFLPLDEVVIKATTKTTAASVASSAAPTPLQIESVLTALKPNVGRVISHLGLAGGVVLCHADSSLNILRREGDQAANSGGWNTVASRAAARPRQLVPTSVISTNPPGTGFVALRKLRKKKKEVEPVEEDWEEAAERLDD